MDNELMDTEKYLEGLIGYLNTCMHKHGKALRDNEWTTRYALVDPILFALGWDLTDPGQVIPEYRPSKGNRTAVDYRLKHGDGWLFVEAKKLDSPLSEIEKALSDIKYKWGLCNGQIELPKYGYITDGDLWTIYKFKAVDTKEIEHEEVGALSLTSEDPSKCARRLRSLRSLDFSDFYQHVAPTGKKRLTDIKPSKGLHKPSHIQFGDEEKIPINKWQDVRDRVYGWLDQESEWPQQSNHVLKRTARLLHSYGKNPSNVWLHFP